MTIEEAWRQALTRAHSGDTLVVHRRYENRINLEPRPDGVEVVFSILCPDNAVYILPRWGNLIDWSGTF